MARDVKSSSRPRPSNKGKGSVWPGIMTGLVIGLGIAITVFYMVSKNPPRFDNLLNQQNSQKDTPTSTQKPEELKPLGDAPAQQQRYDFYKILPGNGEATPSSPNAKPAQPTAPAEVTNAPTISFLQAGSFEHADEADNLKARLAMLGLDVEIQTINLENLGVRHRVRVGPLKSADELKQARAVLSHNGIESVPSK